MAQHTESPQFVVSISEEVKNESQFQAIESPERKKLRVPLEDSPSSACSPELTRRKHREISNSRGGRDEEKTVRNPSGTIQRNSERFPKILKSRLEDPKLGYGIGKLAKEDDDWCLDEDLLEELYPKGMSLLTVFQLVSLVLVLMMMICTHQVEKLRDYKFLDLPLWKWEILVAVIISGHLISGWGVQIVVFFMEQTFLSNIRVLYFVYGMKKAVQHCIWLALIVTAWHFLVAEKLQKESHNKVLDRIAKVLLCLFVGSLVWLVKIVLVKVLASSFHRKNFYDRAKTYLFKQYVIRKLLLPTTSQKESQVENKIMKRTEERKLPQWLKSFPRKVDKISLNSRKNKRKGSVPTLKILTTAVQTGFLESLHTLDESLPDSSDDEEERSSSISNARKLAKLTFRKVAKGSDLIYLEDLKEYIEDEEKALDFIHHFEGAAEREGINEQAFISWMVDAFKERWSLLLSLNDTKTAVDELHRLMDVIVAVIIFIIWLIIFELRIVHFLVLVSTQLALVAFIFGSTCRTVFEAIIFLFVMHPFDVGDRCEIEGVQMVVEEMNILTTVFERYDNQKVIYPNAVLATKPIGNYHRSSDMGDHVEFSIHISTPLQKIDSMKDRIKRYIEENDKHWYRDPAILVKDVEDMNRLIMVVWPRHKINHQDMLQRWIRRSSLINEMIRIFRELEIEYRMLPLDLNVRNVAGTTSYRPPSNWTTCYG